MAGAFVSLVPNGWPGSAVNIEVWSMDLNAHGNPTRFIKARVTNRETGKRSVARSRDQRQALAFALEQNRKLVAAYRLLGLT